MSTIDDPRRVPVESAPAASGTTPPTPSPEQWAKFDALKAILRDVVVIDENHVLDVTMDAVDRLEVLFASALTAEVERLRKAAGFCERHQPTGGARNCLVCSCEKLTFALSRISGLCGDPELPDYDIHYNEEEVVKQVTALRQSLAAHKEWGEKAREVLAAALAGRAATREWRTDSPEVTGKPERWMRDEVCTQWRALLATHPSSAPSPGEGGQEGRG